MTNSSARSKARGVLVSDVGFKCPQCKRNLVSSADLLDRFNEFCDDCGAELEVELDVCVSSVTVINRGTNHDEE